MVMIFINVLVLLIALLHFLFFILEAFLWQRPLGLKIFKLDKGYAKRSAMLAFNQGLYNAFLSAGLIWSVMAEGMQALQLKVFFLSCVLIAGIVGAITISRRIAWIQAIPAGIALVLLLKTIAPYFMII